MKELLVIIMWSMVMIYIGYHLAKSNNKENRSKRINNIKRKLPR